MAATTDVENLTLTGTNAINGTCNGLHEQLNSGLDDFAEFAQHIDRFL